MLHSALLTAVLLGGVRNSSAADESHSQFLMEYCIDCHSEDSAEGHFRLDRLQSDSSDADTLESWALVFDRVQRQEMPPPGAAQPQSSDRQQFLTKLKNTLTQSHRSVREVVQRRLNRREYEHVIHDLLRIDIPLSQFLPEDQISDGFSNNGEALSVSTEQLEAYMMAAETAVNAAITQTEQPVRQLRVATSIDEVRPYFGQQYQQIGEHIVVHQSSKSTYSKVSSRRQKIQHRGKYQITFEAAVHHSRTPRTILVDAGGESRYFEVGPKATTFVIEAILDPGDVVQLHAADLPGWVKEPVANRAPGVGFGPMTLDGPIHEYWPPESHRQLFGEIDPANLSTSDVRQILRSFLPKAFRRPVTSDEIERYAGLFQDRCAAGRNVDQALRVTLTAVLCSPDFLYLGEVDTNPEARIGDYELASRLSFFLWNSQPDSQLLNSAEAGLVRNPNAVAAEVRRMLSDRKAERFVTDFTDHWLHLRRIDETTPDRKLFPEFDDYLKHSMVEESRGYFRYLLLHDLDIVFLLDSDFAMLNRRLAEHYEIENVAGANVHLVQLPADSVRGGVLTQAAVLKVTANGTSTSPVLRGVWVLENLLGRRLPPPPPDAGTIEPDIRGAVSIRDQLNRHRNIESCQVCHQHIDPPGFALEAFDPVGRSRDRYIWFQVNPKFAEEGWGSLVAGADVDSSGQFITGEKFLNAGEFKRLLVKNKLQFARCLTEKLFAYGLGRRMGFSDRPELETIAQRVIDERLGLASTIEAIATSRTFQEK